MRLVRELTRTILLQCHLWLYLEWICSGPWKTQFQRMGITMKFSQVTLMLRITSEDATIWIHTSILNFSICQVLICNMMCPEAKVKGFTSITFQVHFWKRSGRTWFIKSLRMIFLTRDNYCLWWARFATGTARTGNVHTSRFYPSHGHSYLLEILFSVNESAFQSTNWRSRLVH